MQISLTLAAAFAAGALAAPTSSILTRDTPAFGDGNHVLDSVCPAPHGEAPLSPLFPISSMLGSFIGPVLHAAIGDQAVEDIDNVAGELCFSAGNDPGLCQDTAAAVRDFIDAKTPLTQAKQFGCLLSFICVAHHNAQNEGTCNFLLGGADCNANRIIQVKDLECTGNPE